MTALDGADGRAPGFTIITGMSGAGRSENGERTTPMDQRVAV